MSRLAAFLGQAGQEYRQMRLGLHRVRAALERLGHPEQSFASVLIAGTNGKGSTARIVEAVLRQSGHRTGLYTSPHLLRFNERILVAGEEVADDLLDAILAEWAEQGVVDGEGQWPVAGERLTWFEKATVLAFEAFRRSGIEIAVLEVGLGGRMDATNVVEPLASAVISIGLDHAEVLGSSLAEIAREKAGVMRPGRTLVLGPMATDLSALFRAWSAEEGARLIEIQAPGGSPDQFSYRAFRDLSLSLAGRHQLANAAVAIELLEVLKESGFAWDEPALRQGLRSVRNPGRLQWLSGRPPLLLDGAHNPPAFAALAEYLGTLTDRGKTVFLMAMMKEKDPEAALDILGPLAGGWVFAELANPRCLALDVWRAMAKIRKFHAEFFSNSQAALDAARRLAGPDGLVVVTGSLFLVAEILGNDVCHSKHAGAIAARPRFP